MGKEKRDAGHVRKKETMLVTWAVRGYGMGDTSLVVEVLDAGAVVEQLAMECYGFPKQAGRCRELALR